MAIDLSHEYVVQNGKWLDTTTRRYVMDALDAKELDTVVDAETTRTEKETKKTAAMDKERRQAQRTILGVNTDKDFTLPGQQAAYDALVEFAGLGAGAQPKGQTLQNFPGTTDLGLGDSGYGIPPEIQGPGNQYFRFGGATPEQHAQMPWEAFNFGKGQAPQQAAPPTGEITATDPFDYLKGGEKQDSYITNFLKTLLGVGKNPFPEDYVLELLGVKAPSEKVGEETPAEGGLPKPKTKQERDALPKGTSYIDPSGVTRIK